MQRNMIFTGSIAIALLILLAARDGTAQSSVEWGSYLDGKGNQAGMGIAVDLSGNVYATGNTNYSGWVSGGWDTSYGGNYDGYVVKLNTAGAHLWSTYLGGAGIDYGYGVAVDSSGNVTR